MTSTPEPPGDREPACDTPLENVWLTIGRIVAPHGVRGEVKVALLTDRPEELHKLRRVYLGDDTSPIRLERLRLHSNQRQAIASLDGIIDRDAAESLRNTLVRIRASQLPRPEPGSYFHFQIIGLTARDENGGDLGVVAEIIDAGEVDVYVVRPKEGRDLLFPALSDVVLDIAPERGEIIVRPQKWVDE